MFDLVLGCWGGVGVVFCICFGVSIVGLRWGSLRVGEKLPQSSSGPGACGWAIALAHLWQPFACHRGDRIYIAFHLIFVF